MKTFVIAIRATIVTLVLTGLIYPFVITGLAQLLFPWRANGSLVTDEQGQVVGSELIAQGFANAAYFQPRPSVAGEKGYDATSSGGSNLGPTSKKLQDRINDDLKRLKSENPEAMLWQLPRVAKARGITPERVKAVVDTNIEGRTFGVLGEPRVNVLIVNLALDRQFGRPAPLPPAPEKKDTKEATPESTTGTATTEKP